MNWSYHCEQSEAISWGLPRLFVPCNDYFIGPFAIDAGKKCMSVKNIFLGGKPVNHMSRLWVEMKNPGSKKPEKSGGRGF